MSFKINIQTIKLTFFIEFKITLKKNNKAFTLQIVKLNKKFIKHFKNFLKTYSTTFGHPVEYLIKKVNLILFTF